MSRSGKCEKVLRFCCPCLKKDKKNVQIAPQTDEPVNKEKSPPQKSPMALNGGGETVTLTGSQKSDEVTEEKQGLAEAKSKYQIVLTVPVPSIVISVTATDPHLSPIQSPPQVTSSAESPPQIIAPTEESGCALASWQIQEEAGGGGVGGGGGGGPEEVVGSDLRQANSAVEISRSVMSNPSDDRFPLLTWHTYENATPGFVDNATDVQEEDFFTSTPTESGTGKTTASGSRSSSRVSFMGTGLPDLKRWMANRGDTPPDLGRKDKVKVDPGKPDICHACVSCFVKSQSPEAKVEDRTLRRAQSFMGHETRRKSSLALPRKLMRRSTVAEISCSPPASYRESAGKKQNSTSGFPLIRPLSRLHDLPSASDLAESMAGEGSNRDSRVSSVDLSRDPSPEDIFVFYKVLGTGSYGKVHLVSLKATKEILAMKVHLNRHRRRAETELKVFTTVSFCPFLVLLHSHFSTAEALYIVMEYVSGGKLTNKLSVPFSFAATLFYTAQMVMAITHMHNHNILYRDLKPDNVLLTKSQYIKLCDFGSCCFGVFDTKSIKVVMGTPRYWSPEKFEQQPYGRPSDWWSLGVIVYQMMTGEHPFAGEDVTKNFDDFREMVLHNYPTFSPHVNVNAISFCQGLLTKNPKDRLGGAESRNKLYRHPLFRNFNWTALRKQQFKPPPMYAGRTMSAPSVTPKHMKMGSVLDYDLHHQQPPSK